MGKLLPRVIKQASAGKSVFLVLSTGPCCLCGRHCEDLSSPGVFRHIFVFVILA